MGSPVSLLAPPRDLYCNSNGRDIRYRLFTDDKRTPELLAVHGARSSLESVDHLLAQLLSGENIQSVSLDLSGHSGQPDDTGEKFTLRRNLQEVQSIADIFKSSLTSVIGYSLGGALTLKLAERYSNTLDKLVLMCPAIYSDDVYDSTFGDSFRGEITKPFSYLNSSSYGFLKEFSGRVLLIIGEYDGLRAVDHRGIEGSSAGWIVLNNGRTVYSPIPSEVIQGIEAAANHKLTKLVIPDCDHFVLSALKGNPILAEKVHMEISNFLASH